MGGINIPPIYNQLINTEIPEKSFLSLLGLMMLHNSDRSQGFESVESAIFSKYSSR